MAFQLLAPEETSTPTGFEWHQCPPEGAASAGRQQARRHDPAGQAACGEQTRRRGQQSRPRAESKPDGAVQQSRPRAESRPDNAIPQGRGLARAHASAQRAGRRRRDEHSLVSTRCFRVSSRARASRGAAASGAGAVRRRARADQGLGSSAARQLDLDPGRARRAERVDRCAAHPRLSESRAARCCLRQLSSPARGEPFIATYISASCDFLEALCICTTRPIAQHDHSFAQGL